MRYILDMGHAYLNLVGERYGRLIVIEEAPSVMYAGQGNRRKRFWVCRCDCGNKVTIAHGDLRNGRTRSCKCLDNEVKSVRLKTVATRHGGAYTPEYLTWKRIHNRCKNPNNRYYGYAGIKVCERWNSYENFIADMGPKPTPKHSIDRLNFEGDYEPLNCRWATPEEQHKNRRCTKYVMYKNKVITLKEFADSQGLRYSVIYSWFSICKKYGVGELFPLID